MFRLFFFFKQKTAYEMRISDWSSDVCSSDLIVHVEGNRSVLMQVLKNGTVSTLAIIDGIKGKVDELRATLPANLKIAFIGAQSLFVKAAVSGVIREGVIADRKSTRLNSSP